MRQETVKARFSRAFFALFLGVDGGITPRIPRLHLLYDGLLDSAPAGIHPDEQPRNEEVDACRTINSLSSLFKYPV